MLRTRVTVLTGFLGAGKTTLLNALLRDTTEPLGVIVNDFGAINVDATLVSGHAAIEGEVALQNGCICCTLRGDLLTALLRLRRRPQPPSHIIIEASGISDPASIAQTFLDPRLREHIELSAIVACVDPTSFSILEGDDQVLANAQVRVCDFAVVTKADVASDEERTAARAWIESQRPRARIVSSSRRSEPSALVLSASTLWDAARIAEMPTAMDAPHVHEVGEHHGHHHHHHHHQAFETWTYRQTRPLSAYGLRRALAQLPVSVFRAKGFAQVAEDPGVRVVVHAVGTRAELDTAGPWASEPATELIFLGHEGTLDPKALESLFDGCLHDGRPLREGFMDEMVGYFNRLLTGAPGRG